jgi:hypothetical protein
MPIQPHSIHDYLNRLDSHPQLITLPQPFDAARELRLQGSQAAGYRQSFLGQLL